MFYEKRYYRKYINENLTSFEITQGESNLFISYKANIDKKLLRELSDKFLFEIREILKITIKKYPQFYTSLEPIEISNPFLPNIIFKMLQASKFSDVGPWAGVAGAVAFYVGKKLLEKFNFESLFIENGGDCFLFSKEKIKLGIYVPTVEKIIPIYLPKGIWGVSSSSSKKGHSLSFGNTDLATVIVKNDPILSDCLATYFGNSKDVKDALEKAQKKKNLYEGLIINISQKFIIDGPLFSKLLGEEKA